MTEVLIYYYGKCHATEKEVSNTTATYPLYLRQLSSVKLPVQKRKSSCMMHAPFGGGPSFRKKGGEVH
jgi:hypothetical protein